ncbi:barstar family protein [Chitinilyticum aquatile]|uniref:barstar family protein n=1 Tax=Chitinilyticum aquatile TaxID=362520 RepID=UPI00042A8739|nr:barstar family protein [Chitinilyticum aquatile]
MPLTRIVWTDIRRVGDACRQLSAQIATPDYFAANLDALFDVLGTDLPGPLQIDWQTYTSDQLSEPDCCEQLRLLLHDVQLEREDFRYRLG